MIKSAEEFIIRLSSDSYESLFYQMPSKQRSVFLAIASDGKAYEILGTKFINRYHLVSASSVSSAVKGLLDKDFITCESGTYSVYDKFFLLWLKHQKII